MSLENLDLKVALKEMKLFRTIEWMCKKANLSVGLCPASVIDTDVVVLNGNFTLCEPSTAQPVDNVKQCETM